MHQKSFPEQEVLFFSQKKLRQTSGHTMSVVPPEDEEGAACRLRAPATSFTNKSTKEFFWLLLWRVLIGDQDLQRKLHAQAFQHGSARIIYSLSVNFRWQSIFGTGCVLCVSCVRRPVQSCAVATGMFQGATVAVSASRGSPGYICPVCPENHKDKEGESSILSTSHNVTPQPGHPSIPDAVCESRSFIFAVWPSISRARS